MANTHVTITHRADKQSDIASHIVAQITRGDLLPGDRVPSRTALSEQYGVSVVTVQKAIARLQDDGLLVARGRAGTFVTEFPPHLFTFGLVFPERPSPGEPWNHYYQTIQRASETLAATTNNRFATYFGWSTPGVEEDRARLLADVHTGRIAGLIFPSSPHIYEGTPVLDEPGIPRVAVVAPSRYPHVASVAFDSQGFAELAVRRLLAQGRRRIAILMNNDARQQRTLVQPVRRILAAEGAELHDRWCQGLPLSGFTWMRNLLELLTCGDPRERPDGLIIADDNLVPRVIDTLLDLGLRIPEDLAVVASANFPWPTPSAAPIDRFGVDTEELLLTCVEQLVAMRAGTLPEPRALRVRGEADRPFSPLSITS